MRIVKKHTAGHAGHQPYLYSARSSSQKHKHKEYWLRRNLRNGRHGDEEASLRHKEDGAANCGYHGKDKDGAHDWRRPCSAAQGPHIHAKGPFVFRLQFVQTGQGKQPDDNLETEVEHKARGAKHTRAGKPDTGETEVVQGASPYELPEVVMTDKAQHCSAYKQTEAEKQYDRGEDGHNSP